MLTSLTWCIGGISFQDPPYQYETEPHASSFAFNGIDTDVGGKTYCMTKSHIEIDMWLDIIATNWWIR